MANASKDENGVSTLLGTSYVDGTTPVVIWADPTTHRLYTTSNATATAITAVSNAATVPITANHALVTNDSAATLTITMATTNALNMQTVLVQILDFSAAAQTITWVNTENSTVSAPTTSNGSTTLPRTAEFAYNSATSKWRCIRNV